MRIKTKMNFTTLFNIKYIKIPGSQKVMQICLFLVASRSF